MSLCSAKGGRAVDTVDTVDTILLLESMRRLERDPGGADVGLEESSSSLALSLLFVDSIPVAARGG